MSLQRQHFLLNYLKAWALVQLVLEPMTSLALVRYPSNGATRSFTRSYTHLFVCSPIHSFFHRWKVGQAGVLELSPNGPEWAIPGVWHDNNKSSYLDFSIFSANKNYYYTLNSLTLFWLAESVQWIFEISARNVIPADYTIIMSRSRVIMSRSRVIMSCMTAVHDFQG